MLDDVDRLNELIPLIPKTEGIEAPTVKKRRRKPKKNLIAVCALCVAKLVIVAILLVTWWAYGLFYFVDQIPTQPTISKQKVDAAIVLTGGSKRIAHGFSRVANKLAEELFISGVNDDATPTHIVEQVKRKSRPVPANKITLGYKARTTIGNAEEVQEWIIQHNIRSIRLITANYHMPRSLHEFSLVLPHAVEVLPDPVFPKGFDITRWKEDSNSRRLVMSEYHKWLASHLRHFFVRMQIP